ncbi:Hypothetical predicted protein [Olea europaea subsp. europaea]|uniref:Uncharacterized protein n=1 Tax=Olea europaea subsp. europaea TaxID=158383 RepID=A0A8S0VA17_OLEEU|nr:Hypothetical predicted protein [Olea europaea subsp. europaea]
MHVNNGKEQGASGTSSGSLISPMLKVLDEMYSAQDERINAKLIDIYDTLHNIRMSSGLSDPAVTTGIFNLIYETTKIRMSNFIPETTRMKPFDSEGLDDNLVNDCPGNFSDDGLLGKKCTCHEQGIISTF